MIYMPLDILLDQVKHQFNDYQLYLLDLHDFRPYRDYFWKLLSNKEKKKKEKAIQEVKDQYIIGHGILRHLLSKILKIKAKEIIFETNHWGKPLLPKGMYSQSPGFNISHDKDLLLIGFSSNFDMGVDIMNINPDQDFKDIVTHFYSFEEQNFLFSQTASDQRTCFYYIFCQKEALIKAHGKGLSLGLKQFSVNPDFHQKPELLTYPENEKVFSKIKLETPFLLDNTMIAVALLPLQKN